MGWGCGCGETAPEPARQQSSHLPGEFVGSVYRYLAIDESVSRGLFCHQRRRRIILSSRPVEWEAGQIGHSSKDRNPKKQRSYWFGGVLVYVLKYYSESSTWLPRRRHDGRRHRDALSVYGLRTGWPLRKADCDVRGPVSHMANRPKLHAVLDGFRYGKHSAFVPPRRVGKCAPLEKATGCNNVTPLPGTQWKGVDFGRIRDVSRILFLCLNLIHPTGSTSTEATTCRYQHSFAKQSHRLQERHICTVSATMTTDDVEHRLSSSATPLTFRGPNQHGPLNNYQPAATRTTAKCRLGTDSPCLSEMGMSR